MYFVKIEIENALYSEISNIRNRWIPFIIYAQRTNPMEKYTKHLQLIVDEWLVQNYTKTLRYHYIYIVSILSVN